MTDTLTERDYWAVLRAVLETVPQDRPFSARHWHAEAALAELTPSQISNAHKRAVKEGWLKEVGTWIEGRFYPNMDQASHEHSGSHWIRLYWRTDVGYRDTLFDEPPLFEVAE